MLDSPLIESAKGPSVGDFGSLQQWRVASAFTAPAMYIIDGREPAALAGDITAILQELNSPTDNADIRDPDARNGIDLAVLEQAYRAEQKTKENRHRLFDRILQNTVGRPEVLRALGENVTRLGQLIKAASPFAHDNLIERRRPNRDRAFALQNWRGLEGTPDLSDSVPGSLEHHMQWMLEKSLIEKSATAYRSAFGRPVISIVSTSHPTRYLTSKFTDRRGDFTSYARQLTRINGSGRAEFSEFLHGRGTMFEALENMWSAPLTPTAADGGPANFTPFGEIGGGMASMRHMWNVIDEIFRSYDDTQARFLGKEEYDAEAKFLFELSLQFATWIMGDKDGNNNIRSEHLALAALMFRKLGAELYAKQLEAEKSGLVLGAAPDGNTWTSYFQQKNLEMDHLLEPLLERITTRGNDIDLPLSRKEFVTLLGGMDAVYGGPNRIREVTAQFQKELSEAYHRHTATDQEKAAAQALSLLRKTRILGLDMLHFQLRETAEQYQHVIANLLADADYIKLSEQEKIRFLDRFLTEKTPEELAALKESFLQRVAPETSDAPFDRDYGKTGEKPDIITLHTLQRFEIAARQQGLVTDHVLAECKGARQMLETLFLCRVTGAKMLIVPLLEEHQSLKDATPIFIEAFGSCAFRDYMWEMADGDPTKLIKTLKVMFAHSDGMRTMGQPAARANIYEQAHLLSKVMKEFFPELLAMYVEDERIRSEEIPQILARMENDPEAYQVKQFHGGSKCDAVRGGVRSTHGFAGETGAVFFFEETHQGGDGGEIAQGDRAKRLLTTLIAHNARRCLELEKGIGNGWRWRRESALREAIDGTIDDYETNHYNTEQNQLGAAMGEAGLYAVNKAYNSPGSRGGRSDSGGIQSCDPQDTGPVDPQNIRTIPFTTTCMDMGVSASVLPMRNMLDRIDRLYAENEDLRLELAADAQRVLGGESETFKDGKLTVAGRRTLYLDSPIYRAAVVDFPSFGVATSDPALTVKLLKERAERSGIAATPEVIDYFERSIPKDIATAGILGLHAAGFEVPETFIEPGKLAAPDTETCRRLGFLVRKLLLPHLEEQISIGERLHHFGRMLRETVRNNAVCQNQKAYSPDEAYMLRLTGILRSLFAHVFYDGAFDRAAGTTRWEESLKERQAVPLIARPPMPA